MESCLPACRSLGAIYLVRTYNISEVVLGTEKSNFRSMRFCMEYEPLKNVQRMVFLQIQPIILDSIGKISQYGNCFVFLFFP